MRKIQNLKKLKIRKPGINIDCHLDMEEQMMSLKRLTDDLFRPNNKKLKPSYSFYKEDWYEKDIFPVVELLREKAKVPI